jgi:hypothetical protein
MREGFFECEIPPSSEAALDLSNVHLKHFLRQNHKSEILLEKEPMLSIIPIHLLFNI